MSTTLVTGATGGLGSSVIHQMIKNKVPPKNIIAFVRTENKASDLKEKGVTIRLGDFNDVASVEKAMSGVEQVLLIPGTDEVNGLRQHKSVIDAAKKAEVKAIAYVGRSLKNISTLENKLMIRHFQTEDYIVESGLKHVFFRNALYTDTLPIFFGGKSYENGINLPGGSGKVAFAMKTELGEAIGNVMSKTVSENKIYHLTGASSHSLEDVSKVLSEITGKNIKYTALEKSEFVAQKKASGLPEPVIEKIYSFMADVKNGQEEVTYSDLETLLGRKPALLKDALKSVFKL